MPARRRVALASCAAFPQLDSDDQLLLPPLSERGVETAVAVWDDPLVDWDSFDMVVIRSTWDYTQRRDQFLRWARQLGNCRNRAEVLRWNTDKHYLADLARRGVPIVTTEFLSPGTDLPARAAEFVIKPAVSAGARSTARYGIDDVEVERARAHLADLHAAGETALLQPYLTTVDREGETALVYFNGRFSHAAGKAAVLTPGAAPSTTLFVEESTAPRQASALEHRAAEVVLDSLPMERGSLLYARVDLITDGTGQPRLLELELTEPSLFLGFAEGAPERLADAIAEALE